MEKVKGKETQGRRTDKGEIFIKRSKNKDSKRQRSKKEERKSRERSKEQEQLKRRYLLN